MGHNFWNEANEDPGRVAVVDPDGVEVSAGELLARANRCVHGLRALGLRRGDAIAVVLGNEVAMLELYLAATQAGLYLTPVNSHLAPAEIAYIVADCDAKALIACERTGDACGRAVRELGFPARACFSTGATPGFRPFEELGHGQPATLPDDRRAGASMTYTSGTTGRPKGVRRPLHDVPPELVAEGLSAFLSLFGVTPRDHGVHLVVSPLYHTAVLSFATSHLHYGHTVVLMDKWTPEGMLERIARHRVTTSHMVPTQFRRLLGVAAEERARHDMSSLRHVIHSAAPCPVDVKRRMIEWWGPVIYEYYAASEGGGTMVGPKEWLERPGTVGRAWPISRLRIARDDGSECAPGEPGVVYMSMGAHRFEYHKDRDKTASTWQGEFFTVGDVGYLDDQGYLFLCDRKSDMIISGGVNIYPAEIEAVLGSHPRVADVAVFGIPDDEWGEQVKAVVEPCDPDTAGLSQELLSWCRERLAPFKCPRSIDFVPSLPRDPNGKLYKRKLRDPHWAGRARQI